MKETLDLHKNTRLQAAPPCTGNSVLQLQTGGRSMKIILKHFKTR